jgi:hypothetical protein
MCVEEYMTPQLSTGCRGKARKIFVKRNRGESFIGKQFGGLIFRRIQRPRTNTASQACSAHSFFCTIVHRFAQVFEQNLIDGAKGNIYLALKIEPGSLRTLRIN